MRSYKMIPTQELLEENIDRRTYFSKLIVREISDNNK